MNLKWLYQVMLSKAPSQQCIYTLLGVMTSLLRAHFSYSLHREESPSHQPSERIPPRRVLRFEKKVIG